MSEIEYMKKIRGMPFIKVGMRVLFTHSRKWGTITGVNNSANLNVKFDGDNYSCNCHPTWMMQYYDADGKMIAEFRE